MNRGEPKAKFGRDDINDTDRCTNQEVFGKFGTRHAKPRCLDPRGRERLRALFWSNYSVNYKNTGVRPLIFFSKLNVPNWLSGLSCTWVRASFFWIFLQLCSGQSLDRLAFSAYWTVLLSLLAHCSQ